MESGIGYRRMLYWRGKLNQIPEDVGLIDISPNRVVPGLRDSRMEIIFQDPESRDGVNLIHPGGSIVTIRSFDPSAIAVAWGDEALAGAVFNNCSSSSNRMF